MGFSTWFVHAFPLQIISLFPGGMGGVCGKGKGVGGMRRPLLSLLVWRIKPYWAAAKPMFPPCGPKEGVGPWSKVGRGGTEGRLR